MIYLGPKRNSGSTWWAFTSTTGQTTDDIANPVVNSYAWMGYDFLSMGKADAECDAHVVIHETGHLLGLLDYYSYGSDINYGPLGGQDMMDYNFGDHNPYSKLLLGWIKPYVVTGNASITIESTQSKDSVIVLAPDDQRYYENSDGKIYFNAFDEFLLLDYYTDKNLYTQPYDAYNGVPLNAEGGRLYHADGRLGYTYSENGQSFFGGVLKDDEAMFSSSPLIQFINNSNSGPVSEQSYGQESGWDELRWISQDGKVINKTSDGKVNKYSLFSKGTSFSLNRIYQGQFFDSSFDTKEPFSYAFKIDDIK